MCELHYICRLGGTLDAPLVDQVLGNVRQGFEDNRHGFGLFSERRSYRSVSTSMDKGALVRSFAGSSFIVGHNRFRTQGKVSLPNTQPIRIGDVTVAHNGNFYYRDSPFSDTYRFTEELSALLGRAGMDERDAIAEALEEQFGSFSAFFYLHKTGSLYYARDSFCSFTFQLWEDAEGRKIIVGAMDPDRLDKPWRHGFEAVWTYEPSPYTLLRLDRVRGLSSAWDKVSGQSP